DEVYLLFGTEQWAQLNEGQRMDALQEIENRIAAGEGREPYRVAVVPDDEWEPGLMGYMQFNPDVRPTIYLNGCFFENAEDLDFLEFDYSAVTALHTLLHEGRHCFQYEAVLNGNDELDPEMVRDWAANVLCYFCDSETMGQFGVYEFQPMERDANRFAAETLQNIYRHIVNLSGERDDGFEEELGRLAIERITSGLNVALNVDEDLMDTYREQLADAIAEAVDNKWHPYHELAVVYGLDAEESDTYLFKDIYAVMEDPERVDDYIDGLDTLWGKLDDFSDLSADLARFDDWFKHDFTVLTEMHALVENPEKKLDKLDRGFRRFT
ncbi:MAG: hypothetical protein IJ343_04200, partial [Clostridia bacterium]|nr:hypothetical protein [Clostridia bacterium]